MQSLQEKASEWSGVHINDAFAIDETNLYQKLGLQTFIDLSTNFYNRYISSYKNMMGILCLLISVNGLAVKKCNEFVYLDESTLSQFVDFWYKKRRRVEIDILLLNCQSY